MGTVVQGKTETYSKKFKTGKEVNEQMTEKEAQDRFIKATATVINNPPGLISKMLPGGKKREKEYFDTVKKSVEKIKTFKKEHYDWRSTLDEKCWAGYEKKGMKTMFGKRYPNCVKKS